MYFIQLLTSNDSLENTVSENLERLKLQKFSGAVQK